MAEAQSRSDAVPGLGAPPRPFWTGTETLATGASVLWLLVALIVPWLAGGLASASDPLRPVIVAVSVLAPVALIWVAARAARAAREAADDIRRLNFALASLRQSMLADRQARAIGAAAPARGPSAAAPSTAAAARPADPATATEAQASLALDAEAEEAGPDLSHAELIRALHFPDDASDEAGFAALRLALRDRRTRQLIQASQDVLTLLSQDGIYVDDLASDPSRPDIWRRFARGERGGAVAGLGTTQDRDSVAIATNRLREDAVFRDAVHHFLRLFDRRLTAFEPEASDEEIMRLADTRTARAFTLLGRVAGIFD
jgi:hypothetical protein